MARGVRLVIDGIVFTDLHQASWEIHTHVDNTGRPTSGVTQALVKITRVSDDDSGFMRWAGNSASFNWKPGRLELFDYAGSEVKVIQWERGWVSRYDEVCPHIVHQVGEQMYEYFEISCLDIRVG